MAPLFKILIMEKWKDIPGFEGLYQISDLGRIKCLFQRKKRRYSHTDIVRLSDDKQGYKIVRLYDYKNDRSKMLKVHRIVAMVFISNPDSKPVVNHMNGIKCDNRKENLEWCTQKENINHAFSIGLKKRVFPYRKIREIA